MDIKDSGLARIISLVNQAGGVGKTTLTSNLGFHLAERGARVLLVDMDPQASLTRQLGHNPRTVEKAVAHTLLQDEPIPVLSDWHQVDLVPSNNNSAMLESALAQTADKEVLLKQGLQTIRNQYDFILIDCPPSLGLSSIMSLVASTHVLIPIKASDKGLEGADNLGDTLRRITTKANKCLRIAGAVPMMFDKRKVIHRTSNEHIKRTFGKFVVHPPIPESTDFEKSWRARTPLAKLFPNHPAVQSLQAIAAHLETH
ncbi:ATPase involved in chromosome partitioning [Leptolyngbya sp. PCC 7375]|nr:ATPase involved in chromosome partitioning [Leptolyngbya sp. PCC 7375]